MHNVHVQNTIRQYSVSEFEGNAIAIRHGIMNDVDYSELRMSSRIGQLYDNREYILHKRVAMMDKERE